MEPRLKAVKSYSPPATYSQQVSVYCDGRGRCQYIRLAWRCLRVRPAGAAVYLQRWTLPTTHSLQWIATASIHSVLAAVFSSYGLCTAWYRLRAFGRRVFAVAGQRLCMQRNYLLGIVNLRSSIWFQHSRALTVSGAYSKPFCVHAALGHLTHGYYDDAMYFCKISLIF